MNMVPSLASGNRILMLVKGKAGAYICDTGGFAKWDTSGPATSCLGGSWVHYANTRYLQVYVKDNCFNKVVRLVYSKK